MRIGKLITVKRDQKWSRYDEVMTLRPDDMNNHERSLGLRLSVNHKESTISRIDCWPLNMYYFFYFGRPFNVQKMQQ